MLHTIRYIDTTGGTYYAFPSSQSLASWATYRVLLAELTGANLGKYEGIVDDSNGGEWIIFAGGTQPATWDLALDLVPLGLTPDAKKARQFITNDRTREVLSATQWRYTILEDDGSTTAFRVDFNPVTGNTTAV